MGHAVTLIERGGAGNDGLDELAKRMMVKLKARVVDERDDKGIEARKKHCSLFPMQRHWMHFLDILNISEGSLGRKEKRDDCECMSPHFLFSGTVSLIWSRDTTSYRP